MQVTHTHGQGPTDVQFAWRSEGDRLDCVSPFARHSSHTNVYIPYSAHAYAYTHIRTPTGTVR